MRNGKKRTLEGRLEVATAGGQRALDVFEGLAQDLEAAAAAAHEVEVDAVNERVRIEALAAEASATETRYQSRATKIRELFQ